jgi:hypothetical protein
MVIFVSLTTTVRRLMLPYVHQQMILALHAFQTLIAIISACISAI